MRQVLVEKGPIQVKNFNFPIESRSGRRFTAVNYKTKLPNGEDIDRYWLVYSTSKNSIFCFFTSYLLMMTYLFLEQTGTLIGKTCQTFYAHMKGQLHMKKPSFLIENLPQDCN